MKLKGKTLQRFESKFSKEDWLYPGCWTWFGASTVLGYGRFIYRKKVHYAHRISYRHFVGVIPKGKELDHKCRIPWCINPEHLEAVTHRENMLRGNTIEAKNAVKTHCRAGHPLSGDNLYMRGNKRGCFACRRAHSLVYGREYRKANA